MKNFGIALAVTIASVSLLSACGEDPEDVAPTAEASDQAASEQVQVDRDYIGVAGRWSTPAGALPNDQRIVLDIASNGKYSIDVRASGENGDAILESGRGSTVKRENEITGTAEPATGASSVLDRYTTWTLDIQDNQLTGVQGDLITITKE